MAKHVIQMAMVETAVDIALERGQVVIVPHEAVVVEIRGGKLDLDDVVVPVQPRALVIGRQMAQLV
ncbi:hypothetical protein D3C72_2119350 [compost metagenome]